MIWKLLLFLCETDKETQKIWKRKYSGSKRREMITEILRKQDGTIMTPEEQVKFFADFARQKQENVICYLFKHNDRESMKNMCTLPNDLIKVFVCQFKDGRYAATSLKRTNGHLLNRLLQKYTGISNDDLYNTDYTNLTS